jgi:MFS family permease
MYQVSDSAALLRGHRNLITRAPGHVRVRRTVLMLGLTSLFTDISSEMVVTVLPLYLIYVGGFTPLALGLIDGIYQGATALVSLASGYVGDRWRRHKDVATTGYSLSAVCKLLLATVGTAMSGITAIVLLDRVGKGIRTAPRDAMISLSTPKHQLGAAFGVHRALDTTGAVLGPLVAFALLEMSPLDFNTVFVVSFCVALIGLGFLVLLVREPKAQARPAEAQERPSLRAAFALLAVPRYRGLMIAGVALSLATVSDAFVFLAMQRKLDLGTSLFPLLFVASSVSYMLLALPMGAIADRFGRGRVLIAGYVALGAVYVVLLAPVAGWVALAAGLGLLGTYYAATDGVLMAFGSAIVPDELRGSGLALLSTATSLSRLVASLAFGGLWTLVGIRSATACFGVALVVAIAVAAAALRRTREPARV